MRQIFSTSSIEGGSSSSSIYIKVLRGIALQMLGDCMKFMEGGSSSSAICMTVLRGICIDLYYFATAGGLHETHGISTPPSALEEAWRNSASGTFTCTKFNAEESLPVRACQMQHAPTHSSPVSKAACPNSLPCYVVGVEASMLCQNELQL